MNDAVKIVYDFVYSDFCDWYIELSKTRFYGKDDKDRKTALNVSVYRMQTILKLLHPYYRLYYRRIMVKIFKPDNFNAHN